MGNACTRRILRNNLQQGQINRALQPPANGVRNRQDIRRHLRENGYVGFDYIFQNTNAAMRRGPEHSECITNQREVPPPRKENAHDVKSFSKSRFNRKLYRRPIVHYIPEEVDEAGLPGIPPNLMPKLINNVASFKVPIFLTPYVNSKSGVKLQLKFYASSVDNQTLDKYPEATHLCSHLKSLKLWYLCNPKDFEMEPNILLEENHGNIREKSLRLHKRRKMEVRFRLMKKRSFLILGGKDFILRLHRPLSNLSVESLEEGNGETPIAIGTYTRLLDINPNVALDWQVFLWRWYNACNGQSGH